MIGSMALPRVEELQSFFLEAMAVGYASPVTPKIDPHPTLEGWKAREMEVTWRSDLIVVTDEWCNAGGRTLISLRRESGTSITLWCMRYWGTYREKEIPFLKQALYASYGQRQFIGGRGPTKFEGFGFQYHNHPEGDFKKFSGWEMIHTNIGDNMYEGDKWMAGGSHNYWGGMLI